MVEARIYRADLAIRLTSRGAHRVVVLGYQGEPFLLLDADGAFVNAGSLTAAGAGLTRRGGRGWRRYAHRPSVVWHDARVRAVAAGVERRRWTIPVRVDRVPAQVSGGVRRVPPPPAWPWLVVGGIFAAALLLALRSSGVLRPVTVVFRMDCRCSDRRERDRARGVLDRDRADLGRVRHRDRVPPPRRRVPRPRLT